MSGVGEFVKQCASTVASWLRGRYSGISGALDEEERLLLKKEVDLLYRGFLPGAVGTLLVSSFFAAAMWERVGASRLSGWLAAVWVITLMRALLVQRFFRIGPADNALPKWVNAFVVGAAAAGGAWGLTAFLFISGADDVATMLVVFFIAGVSAASVVLFVPVLHAVGAFLLAALVPLSFRLLQLEGSAYLFMGAAVAVYLAVLLAASRRGHAVIWNTMLTGMANERLKEAFIVEKALADEREKTVARLTALERENALFRNMAERAANFVMLVHDVAEQYRIVYANDAACQHFGTDKATLLNWTPYDFDPDCNAAVLAQLASKMRAGEFVSFEAEHRVAGGELVPVEVVAHPFEQDGRILCFSYIHDIRERRKAEAQRLQYEAAVARQEVEEHYRILVETLPDYVVRLDTQARYVYVNPAMLKGIGRDGDVFLGRTAMETGITGNPESDCRLYKETLRAVESGVANVYQDWMILAGRKVCFEIRHIPEKDPVGNVVSVLGIGRDITEQVKIDDALRFIAHRGWSLNGEPFLTALVRYLGKALETDYVIIDRLADAPNKAETVAIFAKGDILPNMCYSLTGTPCENVMGGGICCYPYNVQQRFPDDHMLTDMGVDSYIGLPFWDSAGQVIGLITVMDSKPITDEAAVTGLLQLVATRAAAELERERSERELKAREREYRRLLDDSPDVIVRYDNACRRIYSNTIHRRTLTKPASIGKTPLEEWELPTGKEGAEVYQSHLRKVLDSGMPGEWELAWNDADGNPCCCLVRGIPEFDQHGKVVGVMAVGRDISVRKQLEAATIAREQEFRALVENSPDYISRFDRECRRIYINPCAARTLGDKSELGKTLSEVYPDSVPAQDYEARLRRVLDSGEENQFLLTLPVDDGRHCCYDIQLVPERDENGCIVSVLSIGRDVSERMRLEEELRRQANYDALTGLPNRWSFGERLREEIVKAERSGDNVALLFIDLDRFKEVNDTLGHDVGDQLLVEAARRIQLCLRKSDLVGRLGGDEFVVCLSVETDTIHAGGIAQKIIEAVTRPFTLNEHLAYVSASIGIASYPCDADNADTLLSRADQAMYAAKERGRSGFRFFTPSMQAQAESRIYLANGLRDALSQQQFQVYYQPIVETATGRVVKAEALLRWWHPVLGMVPPDQFIPVAEDTGIIHELGDWVFHEAVNLAMLWREQRRGECIEVSVNISPRQFMHGQYIDPWIDYLAGIGLPGECIAIEITEGVLLDDQGGVMEKLMRLREVGIKVALDDFGTGYSAMAYLKKFNIDYLKIDRSFVRDLAIDESDRAIAETIVVMASRLGLKTIAEGVETVEQRDMLAAVGCEYVQGYLYAPPMPLEEFLVYIDQDASVHGQVPAQCNE